MENGNELYQLVKQSNKRLDRFFEIVVIPKIKRGRSK